MACQPVIDDFVNEAGWLGCRADLSFLRPVECHSVGRFVNFFSLTPSQIGPTHSRKCSLSRGATIRLQE
jgi:hypothetical protein